MIDDIHLAKVISLDESEFNNKLFTYDTVSKDGQSYRMYRYNIKGVNIYYSTITRRLRVKGRLYNLSNEPNRVDTLDRLWAGMVLNEEEDRYQNLDDVLNYLNEVLYSLTGHEFDIREFKVTYIEICFNLNTEHPASYIKLFNSKFDMDKPKRYKNFILTNNISSDSSFYIKTNREYEKNSKNNYVINFYNKLDHLNYIRSHNRGVDHVAKVSELDIEKAENILRMEVQCAYQYLEKIREEYNIEGKFKDFINIVFCSEILRDKYRYFIDKNETNDFYKYKEVKKIIEASDIEPTRRKKALMKYCTSLAQGSTMSQYKTYSTRKKYNDMLTELGIHRVLIQPRFNCSASRLISPMKLLDHHINVMINRYNDMQS